jgi:hypothetical protein
METPRDDKPAGGRRAIRFPPEAECKNAPATIEPEFSQRLVTHGEHEW